MNHQGVFVWQYSYCKDSGTRWFSFDPGWRTSTVTA
jgi:hypothetical protein